LDAARVKAAVPPLDFYRVELPGMPPPKHDHGWTSGGLCPFHADEHVGSFRIDLDTGRFVCFSCGARGADVIAFTQLRHSVSFPDALRLTADAWGIRA
jgi:hypothetical protein